MNGENQSKQPDEIKVILDDGRVATLNFIHSTEIVDTTLDALHQSKENDDIAGVIKAAEAQLKKK